MPWAAFVFGWPAAISSILLGLFGVMSRRWTWTAGGALAGGPFLLYLSLIPPFGWIAMLVAVSYAGSVVATYRERVRLAWLLFAPMVVLVGYVGYVVSVVAAAQVR